MITAKIAVLGGGILMLLIAYNSANQSQKAKSNGDILFWSSAAIFGLIFGLIFTFGGLLALFVVG